MTTTTNKGYTLPTVGADFGVWGNELNGNFGIIDNNISGIATVSVMGSTNVTATASNMQNLVQKLVGNITADIRYIIPAQGFWIIQNSTTGAFNLTVGATSTGAAIPVPAGLSQMMWSDGTNMYAFSGGAVSGTSLNVTGPATIVGTTTITGNTTITGAVNVTGSETLTGILTAVDPNAQGGVVINGTVTGAALRLNGNGTTTPNKWIRAINGYLSVVNNAYSAEIFQVRDNGDVWLPGTLNAAAGSFSSVYGASAIQTGSGNITANGGRCRASYGYNAGDLAACVIGADFARWSGNYGVGYCGYTRLPNGIIIQAGYGVTDCFVSFPTAFNGILGITVTPITGGPNPITLGIGNQQAGGFSVWGAQYGYNTAVCWQPNYSSYVNALVDIHPVSAGACGFYWTAIGF